MPSETAPRKIMLKRIAHVYYQYADLEKAIQFLLDFGFVVEKRFMSSGNKDGVVERREVVYFRGYGTEPWVLRATEGPKDEFGGVGFVVETYDDLVLASETLPGATPIYEIDEQESTQIPGGGMGVDFKDPVDGFAFHLVYGQKPREVGWSDDAPVNHHGPVNYPTEKNRPVNKKQRFQKGPAPVHKLGHFGHCTTDFARAFEFYSSRFNFKPSDIVHNDKNEDITVFWRLDRGKEEVDHHCFFFYGGPKYHVHHTSYETYDFDTQVLGHDWLREKGYKNCWGVGRHVLGSQIFDYWFAPSGFVMEHYVDGDLADCNEPTHRSAASPDSLHIWGPDVPKDFLE